MFNLWYKHGVGKNWFKNLEYSLCINLRPRDIMNWEAPGDYLIKLVFQIYNLQGGDITF